MAILKILTYPDSRLNKVAEPVTEFTNELAIIVENMFETMYKNNGVGLAATQVDIHKRIFVMDTGNDGEKAAFINPKIIHKEGEELNQEGCLSFPDIYVKVKRAKFIKVEFNDLKGNVHQAQFSGLAAICVQHEIDHLDGITFIKRISTTKRELVARQLEKLASKD